MVKNKKQLVCFAKIDTFRTLEMNSQSKLPEMNIFWPQKPLCNKTVKFFHFQ